MAGSASVVITTVLSIFVAVGIVGNCLVCAIIKRNRVMRYFCEPDYVEHNRINSLNEKRSLIPWGLRVPINRHS